MVYYSGHGTLLHGTQRVSLHDCDNFALEIVIRNFKNRYSKNAYAWQIFDSCRSSAAPISERVKAGEQQEFQEVQQGDSNMVIVFSSEPTKTTSTADRVTHALFEWLDSKEKQAGVLIFPDALIGLNHRGLEVLYEQSKSL